METSKPQEMNTASSFVRKRAPQQTQNASKADVASKKPSSRKKNVISNAIKGSFLANEKVRKNFPFIIFLAMLAMLYIFNNYLAEKNQRAIKKIEPIHEAYLTNYRNAEAQYTDSSKLSNISQKLISIGLKEARVSPRVIKTATEE